MFERYKEMEKEQIGSEERGRKKGGGRMEREKRGEKKKEKEVGMGTYHTTSYYQIH